MNYFIISQPRCGTAWLANALTWGNSFCYHEGIYGYDSMDDYADMLNSNPAEFVGDSDTGLALMLPWLYARYPDAKYIFVNRNTETVSKSLKEIGYSTANLDEINRSIQWGIRNINGLIVEFEDIFTKPEVIWDYIGLENYPTERFEMLSYMKINDHERFSNAKPINFGRLMRGVA